MGHDQHQSSEDLRNEVLRRVGRNLLLYQQVELILKWLVANVVIETGPSGPTAAHTQRRVALRRKTLGQVREQFFEEVYREQPERTADADVNEIRVRSTFRISVTDGVRLREDEARFEAMTEERNELVHHFLEQCQLSDPTSLSLALDRLDEQRENVLALHRDLARLHETVVEGMKATAAFFQSAEGAAAVELMLLQSSKIVALLAQATVEVGRPDGWTLLSSAGHFVAAADPEQLPAIRLRFGHRGLRSLVAAAECFDLRDEVTPAGGQRAVYRLKHELQGPAGSVASGEAFAAEGALAGSLTGEMGPS